MVKKARAAERRDDALSRERIVDAAIELLDHDGEEGLTFRALAARLATGPGALYWHIASKNELLVAASDTIVARATDEVRDQVTPHEAIRRIAVGVFDAFDAHPWVGTQLSRAPWESPMLQIFERIGRQLQALGVEGAALFTAASALWSYIIGVSAQNAANGRLLVPTVDRREILETVAAQWKTLDAAAFPFVHHVAAQLPVHDDKDEFLAGIDLILAGIAASHGRRGGGVRPGGV